ncbi:MAG TPA: PIN domain-containing protein [Burkholderiales bacterium]
MDRVLVDSGFLVAYGKKRDPLHSRADRFLSTYRGALFTISAVIVETCFFLDAGAKRELLEWVGEGSLSVVEVPVTAYPDLSAMIGKYASREVDFADAALVWLAEQSGIRRVLTTDRRDFHTYRLKNGKHLEPLDWF